MSQHINAVAKQSGIDELNSNTNLTNDILADALTSNKTKFFSGTGSSYTGTVPNGNYKYGTFMVNRRYGVKTVLAQSANNDIAINTYDGSTWTGWQELALNSKFTPTHQNINFIPSTTRVDVASIIKSGQIVMVCLNNVSFTDAVSSEDVTLATLPYKPVNWVRFFGYTINGNPIALGVNPSSGNLICSGGLTPVEAGKLIYASFTYITGD